MKNVDQVFQERCRKGLHPFMKILEQEAVPSFSEDTVVRWCPVCGTISVDIDVDGRIKPGAVQRARRPKILEEWGE